MLIDWTIFHAIPGVVLLFVLISMQLVVRKSDRAQTVLMVFWEVAGLSEITVAQFYGNVPEAVVFLEIIHMSLILLMVVSYRCFILETLTPRHVSLDNDAWWLGILLLWWLINVIGQLTMSPEHLADFYTNVVRFNRSAYYGYNIYTLYYMLGFYPYVYGVQFCFAIVILVNIFRLRAFYRKLSNFYAEDRYAQGVKMSVVSTILTILIAIALVVRIFATGDQENVLLQNVYLFLNWLMIPFALAHIYYLRNIMDDFRLQLENNKLPLSDVFSSSSSVYRFTNEEEQQIAERLNQVTNEEFYRRSDITLPVLADMCGTTPTAMREYIENNGYQSFAAMVRDLRMIYARHYKQEHPEISLEELSKQAGYTDFKLFMKTFKRF